MNNLLTNPCMPALTPSAGPAAGPRSRTAASACLRGHRKNRSDWAVLLVDHHEGYLPWVEYERNQRLIADNANGKGMMVRGTVRKGEALLAGLVRCGHCGRRLLVSYNGAKGDIGRYNCDAIRNNPGAEPCISFGALRVDDGGGRRDRAACCSRSASRRRCTRSRAASSGPARSGARSSWRSSRRGMRRPGRGEDTTRSIPTTASWPANSSGGGRLPSRPYARGRRSWTNWRRRQPAALGAEERRRLMRMGADLEAAWHHPAATATTRKRILRVVLREVVTRVEGDQIQLLLHWQGGDHTRLEVRKNRRGRTRWSVEPETVDLVRACARLMPDKAIAGMLNRMGQRTGRLNGWTQSRVRSFRNTHGIAAYVDDEWAERGEVTLPEAARMLGLSPMTVLRHIRAGVIPAEQYCKGAPWVIKRRDVEERLLAERVKAHRGGPPSTSSDQQTFVFPMM